MLRCFFVALVGLLNEEILLQHHLHRLRLSAERFYNLEVYKDYFMIKLSYLSEHHVSVIQIKLNSGLYAIKRFPKLLKKIF